MCLCFLISGAEIFDRTHSDGSCLCPGIGMTILAIYLFYLPWSLSCLASIICFFSCSLFLITFAMVFACKFCTLRFEKHIFRDLWKIFSHYVLVTVGTCEKPSCYAWLWWCVNQMFWHQVIQFNWTTVVSCDITASSLLNSVWHRTYLFTMLYMLGDIEYTVNKLWVCMTVLQTLN